MFKILSSFTEPLVRMNNMPTTQLAVFYITAGSKEEGQKVADGLVSSKLAACVNVIEGVQSTYLWEGKINSDKEVLLVVKSRLSLLGKIETKVKELHSYDVPELIALPIAGGSSAYMKWVKESTIEE